MSWLNLTMREFPLISPVVHHKNIAIFPRALESIASHPEDYQT